MRVVETYTFTPGARGAGTIVIPEVIELEEIRSRRRRVRHSGQHPRHEGAHRPHALQRARRVTRDHEDLIGR